MLRSEARDDADRIAAVLRGVRAYQAAPRPSRHAATPIRAQVGRAMLRSYGGAGRPVVFVPSLINSAAILDVDPDRSLLRWLATQGLDPMLVEWGEPAGTEAHRTIGDHVTDYLAPLLATLPEPPILVGYCLGGTMAIAAAAVTPVRALALMATPWRFGRYPPDTRTLMLRLWEQSRGAAARIGLLPMEVLQAVFWQIDPARTFGKFAEFGRVCDDPAAVAKFVPVEDWANDGPPLPYAAARDLFETMVRDDLPGSGAWMVADRVPDPAGLRVPILEIVSTTDRIVPAAAAAGVGRRLSTGLGHVGMIVGGEARRTIWEPLAGWLRAV